MSPQMLTPQINRVCTFTNGSPNPTIAADSASQSTLSPQSTSSLHSTPATPLPPTPRKPILRGTQRAIPCFPCVRAIMGNPDADGLCFDIVGGCSKRCHHCHNNQSCADLPEFLHFLVNPLMDAKFAWMAAEGALIALTGGDQLQLEKEAIESEKSWNKMRSCFKSMIAMEEKGLFHNYIVAKKDDYDRIAKGLDAMSKMRGLLVQ